MRAVRNGRLLSFVLVHGAWHDACAWDQLRAVLDGRGCGSIAVDLPSEDVAVDASGYAHVIAAAADRLGPEPVVVVGHSMAGIAIPLVPALAPVRQLVFLAALIPADALIALTQADAREYVRGQ
jgi:pimeloyl-ACP methyl ester carboxylesterase